MTSLTINLVEPYVTDSGSEGTYHYVYEPDHTPSTDEDPFDAAIGVVRVNPEGMVTACYCARGQVRPLDRFDQRDDEGQWEPVSDSVERARAAIEARWLQ